MGSFPLAQSPRFFSRITAFVGKFRWESPVFYRHNSGERSIKKEREKCTESPKINWRAHTQWSVRIRSRKSALSDANVTRRSLVGTIACDHRDLLLFTAIYFQSSARRGSDSSDSSFYPRCELIHGEYRYSRCVAHLITRFTCCLRTRVFHDGSKNIIIVINFMLLSTDSLESRGNRVFAVVSSS